MEATVCPACDDPRLRLFHSQDGVPVHSCLLLAGGDEARSFPRGTIRLAFCEGCGFITNTAFDERLQAYSTRYEETQGCSPCFRTFAEELAVRWIERYGLRGKAVLEIGCGKGEFLELVCRLGGNQGIGIDPSFMPGRLELDPSTAARTTFIQDFYSRRYGHLTGDAIVCRHTLEHIHGVRRFMVELRESIGDRDDVVVLFELPDVRRVLEETAFWDIYYEHCSYFSLGSLARLFRATGFEVLDLSLAFDEQYILIEAKPSALPGPTSLPTTPVEDDREVLAKATLAFEESFRHQLREWRAIISSARAQGRRPVIWGSGSKGVAFLTTLGIADEIECVVDINPRKQGMFMAGTGHRIVAPEHLIEHRPDLVVVMNPVYTDEIREMLAGMGLSPELVAV